MKPIVFVEGGGAPNDVHALPEAPVEYIDLIPHGAIGTRQALADAFYLLFEKAVPSIRVIFDILLNGGYRETIRKYIEAQQNIGPIDTFLMIDYQDLSGENRQAKYLAIQAEVDKTNRIINISYQIERIFFMVQKMDAWILSQPNVIDEVFPMAKKDLGKIQRKINLHSQRIPSEIYNPDYELKVLLGYYEEERKGQRKKLKYGKIKTAIRLLPRLDIEQLQHDFEDVQRFVELLRSLTL